MAKKKESKGKKVVKDSSKASNSYSTMKSEGSKMSTKVGNIFKKGGLCMGGKVK